MVQAKRPQFGKLSPRYNFVLNPYPELRMSSCPFCKHKTGQRKLPLLIHVEPRHLIALNYTCRYCQSCDLLIAHKHEIEHHLTQLFSQMKPEVVGNEYLIIGTVEKTAWRENLICSKPVPEMLPYVSDFEAYYQELRVTRTGWYMEGHEPPIKEPMPSQEWVKAKSGPSHS